MGKLRRRNWDVFDDSEEYERLRNEMAEIISRGEKPSHCQIGKLGGVACREKHGFPHYMKMARRRWGG